MIGRMSRSTQEERCVYVRVCEFANTSSPQEVSEFRSGNGALWSRAYDMHTVRGKGQVLIARNIEVVGVHLASPGASRLQ